MKAPKLVHWYARKAGVPIDHANVLWRRAVREATSATGWVGSSEYWGAAMDIFLRLLDQEQSTFCAPRVTPLLRTQSRVMRLPLLAIEDMVSAVGKQWQDAVHQTFCPTRHAA